MTTFQQDLLEKVKKLSPLYLVGGATRDHLMNLPSKDIDVVIELSLDELEKVLRDWGYTPLRIGAKHSTISVFQDAERIDFNFFSGDLNEDALRRDFTINAIYQDLRTERWIDPLGGSGDIEKQILRSCGEPEDRFKEDPIRILRMVRFSVKYGLVIEEKTLQAAQELIGSLAGTASERISEELGKILTLEDPESAILLLDQIGYWEAFLPELARLKGLVQNQYHAKDAWEHTLHVVRNTPSRLLLRLAGLFHDLGKWETASRECYAWGKCTAGPEGFQLGEFRILGRQLYRWNGQFVEVHGARLDYYPDTIQVKHIRKTSEGRKGFEWVENGKRHFLGHEKESGRLARQIFPRFRFSMVLGHTDSGGEKELVWLIENHMSGTLAFMSELRGESKAQIHGKARRFAWEKGWTGRAFQIDRLRNLLDLWRADFFGGKQRGPNDEEIFEKIQRTIKSEAEMLASRSATMEWGELDQFAQNRKITGKDYGDFKDYLRTTKLLNFESSIPMTEMYLEQEYKKYLRKR